MTLAGRRPPLWLTGDARIVRAVTQFPPEVIHGVNELLTALQAVLDEQDARLRGEIDDELRPKGNPMLGRDANPTA